MNGDDRQWLRDRGEPRVQVKTRVVRRGDTPCGAIDPLRSALREAEREFLALQSGAVAGTPIDVLSEFLEILADLKRIDEHLQEAADRRDISYVTDRRLNVLNEHCRWLTRRVSTESLLMLQIHLEQEVKLVIGPHAYQMFLRLEEVMEVARDMEALSDSGLMARLREGALIQEIHGQVRPDDGPRQVRRAGMLADCPPRDRPSG